MATPLNKIPLAKYFNGDLKHAGYKETCKLADAIRVHADGLFPGELIEGRRPSESEEIKKYRKTIWEAITKSTFKKVLIELMKIRKSEEWNITYPLEVPASIKEGEDPRSYFEFNWPFHKSVTNWAFNILLRQMAVDTNSVCMVLPLNTAIADNDYYKPYALLFNSHAVYQFIDNDYAVLLSPDVSIYYSADGKVQFEGKIFYVITTQQLIKYKQVAGDKFEPDYTWNHHLGYLPAFKLAGEFKKVYERSFITESRLSGMIPHLNEAVREYSDLQAEVVQHIHSEAVIFQNQDCNKCAGLGYTNVLIEGTENYDRQTCMYCKGFGSVNTSPYGHMIVRPGMKGEEAIPWPPKQYIQKQTEIVKIQDERIDAHSYKALAAVNMEFLAHVPEVQSGVAKAYDTDGLNTFANAFAEDLVFVMDRYHEIAVDIRYWFVEDKKQREQLIPKVAVPEHFDYINANLMIEKMTNARNAKVHPVIITAMELAYANAEFNNDPDVRDELKAIYSLDPFPGLSSDEKSSNLSNDLIDREDAVISANIQQFIKRAIRETNSSKKPFLKLDHEEQLNVLKKYAQALIVKNSAAAKVKSGFETEAD